MEINMNPPIKENEIIEKKHPVRTFFLVIIILIVALVVYARYISTSGLIVKEYGITNELIPENFHGVKVIQFSDIHYGRTVDKKSLSNIINKINDYKPDIVVFTGDLIDKSITLDEDTKKEIIIELSRVEALIGKYAVKGNHDYVNDEFDSIMESTDFKILNNSNELIHYKDVTPIEIIGLPSIIQDYPNYEEAFKQVDDNNYYKILLTHEPDVVNEVVQYNPNLMLSGHSHGGQIRLPFVGAIIKPIGAKKYYDEHYTVDETELYISSGIGTSTANFRFMNRPSINLFRLYNH